jgi:hypothetical protein
MLQALCSISLVEGGVFIKFATMKKPASILIILVAVLTSCGKMDNLTAFSKRKYLKNFPKQKQAEKMVYDKEEYSLDEPVLLSGLDDNPEIYLQGSSNKVLTEPDSICKLHGCNAVTDNLFNKYYSYCYYHKCDIDSCDNIRLKKEFGYFDFCEFHLKAKKEKAAAKELVEIEGIYEAARQANKEWQVQEEAEEQSLAEAETKEQEVYEKKIKSASFNQFDCDTLGIINLLLFLLGFILGGIIMASLSVAGGAFIFALFCLIIPIVLCLANDCELLEVPGIKLILVIAGLFVIGFAAYGFFWLLATYFPQ